MPIEMKIHILARAVDACLDAALATAPSNYRMRLEDMQGMIRELLEDD